jgi:hypothetical protein
MATAPTSSPPIVAASAPKPRRKWLRRLGYASLVGVVAMFALWIGVNRIPWLGAAIADGIRAVLGPGAVAWLEDTAYGAEDKLNVWRHGDDAPTTLWDNEVVVTPDDSTGPGPRFLPPVFTAPYPRVATPADGHWIPIKDPGRPDAAAPMFKSMVHPDEKRPFAVLAVVAIDTESLELKLVAGTTEPTSNKLKLADRPGIVPNDERGLLVAAFNGGFKTTHGQYGMMVGGVEFLPPRDIACTFAAYHNDTFRVGTWSDIKGDKDQMRYYRQTPPCLAENGEIHKLLHYNENATGWGATVSGDTVIRRSAIGLSKDGKIIYYGLGEAMTAQSLARGMVAAGAHDVAELDVNFSYPRFLFYDPPTAALPPMVSSAIIPHIEFGKYQYVSESSPRDFFYLTRRPLRTGSTTTAADGDYASK